MRRALSDHPLRQAPASLPPTVLDPRLGLELEVLEVLSEPPLVSLTLRSLATVFGMVVVAALMGEVVVGRMTALTMIRPWWEAARLAS